MEKNKKTLTISSNLKEKIDTTSFKSSSKKSFSVGKKDHSDQINNLKHPNLLQILILIKT